MVARRHERPGSGGCGAKGAFGAGSAFWELVAPDVGRAPDSRHVKEQRMTSRSLLAAVLVATGAAALSGGDSVGEGRRSGGSGVAGDPVRGEAYARDVCASCHAVERGAPVSPVADAPTLQEIAETPGMTSLALTVWLTTFHPERTMPALVVAPQDRQDVIAYILSLADE
jgi:mono/diheme cytochrome c family protein